MHALSTPTIQDAQTLLETVELLSNDLEEKMMESFLGIYSEDRLVAMGGLEIYGGYALLRSVATAPTHQRQGLAGQIVAALEILSAQAGVADLYLLTESAESHFSKLGFCRVERDVAPHAIAQTGQFRDLCPDSAAFMHKRLGS